MLFENRYCWIGTKQAQWALVLLWSFVFALACDSNVEPYVPGEEPRQPDLAKIFPEGAQRVPRSEAEIRQAPGPPGARSGMNPVGGSNAAAIRGSIRVSESLQDRVPKNGVLFLIARTAAGGPPLAVKALSLDYFPQAFEIGPADRMIPDMPFVGPIRLSARIDVDGNASSKNPGDLVGELADALEPGAENIEIIIDTLL